LFIQTNAAVRRSVTTVTIDERARCRFRTWPFDYGM
jgi:hypothetical protein